MLTSNELYRWVSRNRRLALALPLSSTGRRAHVAQRSIELFIGRLITDEGFREAFLQDSKRAIRMFVETGPELTTVEVAALLTTRGDLWERVADEVDPRLQKTNLHSFSKQGS
jgi:hypothetical protein